ncbi:hypothetical protein HUJ04_012113 [Dendroctonus ponderosae]|nr:hypothetical protein HUJ04_012113 [Dendroctonus ponderosae]KAH1029249.1 hypothetical protein HUJ05_002521 [Dendroctonus ponderosae]
MFEQRPCLKHDHWLKHPPRKTFIGHSEIPIFTRFGNEDSNGNLYGADWFAQNGLLSTAKSVPMETRARACSHWAGPLTILQPFFFGNTKQTTQNDK